MALQKQFFWAASRSKNTLINIEDTISGLTIHLIDEGLDTGINL